MNGESHAPPQSPLDDDRPVVLWNVPNSLCWIRLVGSFVLIALAFAEQRMPFFWLMLFLLMTDWVDGKLAVWLNQQTTFGARLDSVADAALYAAILTGGGLLMSSFILAERSWLLAALASFLLTCLAGLVRYGRLPSYHTKAAKFSWLLVTVAVIALFAVSAAWPFRIAMAAVVVTNLEATAMTMVLPTWQTNVPSIWHAWGRRTSGEGRDE